MGIVVRGLTKRYGGKTIVDSVSIDIADGEIFIRTATTLYCIAKK